MSRIFISHSSADNEITRDILQRLEQAGFENVFLDHDTGKGITAGVDWENELYRELRACQAMIVVCSHSTMNSNWCFAEITHAKSKGIEVFPIQIDDSNFFDILGRKHGIDWTQDPEDAWKRLQRGLLRAGIDPSNSFAWDGTRPPYRGLHPFEPEDAAIFFGREDEIQQGLQLLNAQRRLGNTRSLLILGPSGSGKSSLAKAGILPRIQRNDEDWVVLDVMRPHNDPLRGLEEVLRKAFQQAGSGSPSELKLASASDFCEALVQLIELSDKRGARVLLIVDQAEELLGDRGNDQETEQGLFFDLVMGSLGKDDCPLHVIWTLRSDFLPEFQRQLASRELKSDKMHLELMDRHDLVQAIKNPAELVGVKLESGLTQKMITDIHDGHALPLLSFTLSALFQAGHQDGLLEISEYQQLGGVAGALRTFAEEIFSTLDEQQQESLAKIFLSMTRLEQNGRLSRRPIKRDSIPGHLVKVVDLFVDKHLLVAGADDSGGTLEVAHEELFRAWDRLQNWLDRDRDYLLWNRRMDYAVQEWLQSDKRSDLLMTGEPLSDAERHLKKHPGNSLSEQQEAFLDASRIAQRKLDSAKNRNRFLINGLGVLLLGGVVIVGIMAVKSRQKTDQLFAADVTALADAQESPLIKNLLVSSLEDYTPPAHAIQVAINVAQKPIPLSIMAEHENNVTGIACSPDGKRVVSSSSDSTARVWAFDQLDKPVTLSHDEKRIDGANFSHNSRYVLSWSSNGNVYKQLADGTGSPRLVATHKAAVVSAQFNPEDDRYLMTASEDGTVNIWNISGAATSGTGGTGKCQSMTGSSNTDSVGSICKINVVAELGSEIGSASYSPDGRFIVAVVVDEKTPHLWRTDDFTRIDVPQLHAGDVIDAVFSPVDKENKSSYLVTTSKDNTAILWKMDNLGRGQGRKDAKLFSGHTDWVTSAQFSPDGKYLVTNSDDDNAILWNIGNIDNRVVLSGHSDDLTSSVFSANNKFLVTASNDDKALVWDLDTLKKALDKHATSLTAPTSQEVVEPVKPLMVLASHLDNITATAFCANDQYLITASNDDTVQLWDLLRPVEPTVLISRDTPAADVDFNWDGSLIAVAFECRNPVKGAGQNKCDPALLLEIDGTVRKELGYARSVDFIPEEKIKNGDYVLTVAKKDLGNKHWPFVREWPVGDGKAPWISELVRGSYESAVYGPKGNSLITANLQGVAEILDTEGTKLGCCDSHGRNTLYAEFSHDGDSVVTAMGSGKTAKVSLVPDPENPPTEPLIESHGNHRGFVTMAVFSPDDQYIATASVDKTIRLSSVDDSENERVFIGHTGRVNSVAFSPDGKRLVSASEDGEARIWNTDRTGEAIRLRADGSAILDATFSPDGRRIITASRDGNVRIWRFLWEDLLGYLDEATRVCLSVDQRAEFLQEKDQKENDPAFENYDRCLESERDKARNQQE